MNKIAKKNIDVENLIDEARLALVALEEVATWSDENEKPASFVKYCRPRLKQALERFEK